MLDCRPKGNVGGVCGREIGDLRAVAKEWQEVWRKNDWNQVRVVVKGNPPEIHTWVNGKPMVKFKDNARKPRLPETGRIALKINGGDECFNNAVQFRRIRVRAIE